MLESEKILKVNIEEEMQSSYIDYAMSVIVSRALPDIRDGLKPVQRRILYGMSDLGLFSNKPYKKSARIVGEVLGKYHPHGDVSVYDAMVRMAQPWSLRYTLIDGQGNFGSIDDDPPAAMRYTEARLLKIAEEMLADIDKDTVDFKNNFDESLQEPTVLPARIPNLLINGVSGIAVGMATNMAPHNLSEVVDGIIAYINNNEITIDELMKYIKAPDFPTGGIIYGYDGVKSAFETGRGRIVLRAKADIEIDKHDRAQIIVTEIPYQVNKAELIAKTDELVRDKKIEGIDKIRDESDREGLRIVYELKKGFNPQVILNQLFKETALQSVFNVNNVALVDGRPRQLSIKDLIVNFVEHRHKIILRRTRYELKQAEEKSHILKGLLIALAHIDEVIKTIKTSKNPDEAKERLMKSYKLTEIQAKAILDMRLQRLTALEQNKIKEEQDELLKKIQYYNDVLQKPLLQMKIIKDELLEIKEKYGDKRRTQIEYQGEEFRIEDTIIDEEVVITVSRMGYIKRTSLREYRRQIRGGRGYKGTDIREEDFIQYLFIARTLNYLLLFTEKGRCYWIRVYEIPEGAKVSRGRAIQNILSIDKDDKINAIINVRDIRNQEYVKNNFIVLCTKKGIIKKTTLEAYSRPRPSGIIAISLDEGDQLLEAHLTNGKNEIMLALKSGYAVRFHESKVRPMGRITRGVRGVKLHDPSDEVIGMICINDPSKEDVLVVSEKGLGKRSKVDEYRLTNRGAKGVKTIKITPKTGKLVAIKNVTDADDIIIINKSGIVIRLAISTVRVIGRTTQGVRLIKLDDNDSIASIAKVYIQSALSKHGNGNDSNNENYQNPKLNLSEN